MMLCLLLNQGSCYNWIEIPFYGPVTVSLLLMSQMHKYFMHLNYCTYFIHSAPKRDKKSGLLLNFVENKSFLISCFTSLECASYFNEQAIWWWSWRTVQLASRLQPNVPSLADCVWVVSYRCYCCVISVWTHVHSQRIFFVSIYFCIAAFVRLPT